MTISTSLTLLPAVLGFVGKNIDGCTSRSSAGPTTSATASGTGGAVNPASPASGRGMPGWRSSS